MGAAEAEIPIQGASRLESVPAEKVIQVA